MGSCGCSHGPGFKTPLDALNNGPREELLYVVGVVPDKSRPDFLATIDVNPTSPTYSQIIHTLPVTHKGDELHHSGWNSCSSCYGDPTKSRRRLILPGLTSGRVYGVDVATDPRAPRLELEASPESVRAGASDLGFLHTTHCLGDGTIVISALGDAESGAARGGFVRLDQDLKVLGTWNEGEVPFGYDFWYQPYHDVLLSTSWGAPRSIQKGLVLDDLATEYGDEVYVWSWSTRTHLQTIKLGDEGKLPLEVRFKHDPKSLEAFVGSALGSNIHRFHRGPADANDAWKTEVAYRQRAIPVEGWALPELPPLITDILISLDDRFLFFSNWLRGDVVALDISDPTDVKRVGQLYLGGSIGRDGPVKVTDPDALREAGLEDGLQPVVPSVKGTKLRGGPQMLQLSLDGKRLYVTNSLYSHYDKQFYPELVEKGAHLLRVDVGPDGSLTLDETFFVDFGALPDGPALAHETRYPGGDCSSDIWLAED